MDRPQAPDFWLNAVLDQIEARYPTGEIVVSSGISPSASYHVGHFREILSADIIKLGLETRGRQARHIHVVDNFDPLRKRYEFLPVEYEQYVGWPVCLVPSPDGEGSYADHFYKEFKQNVERLNIDVEILKSYEDLYKAGKMAGQIERVLERIEAVKAIFEEVSNRQLEEDWTPIQVVSDSKKLVNARLSTWDKAAKTIEGVPFNDGRAKLNWRLDWPARWQVLGVMVEPHGRQEHGAAGGSYETGVRFAKEIFEFEPPIPGVQYGHIFLPGETKKMSSSLGNHLTPAQAFAIMPPEMLRYWIFRYPGTKNFVIDPGLGLFNMLDEFAGVDRAVRAGESHQFAPAYQLATTGLTSPGLTSIPFSHLVSVYQAGLGDHAKIIDALERSGYQQEVSEQAEALEHELQYVKSWLDSWAPETIKFTLQAEPPTVELSDGQRQLLHSLADAIAAAPAEADGQWFHNQIHAQREPAGLTPAEAFQAIYRILLGKDAGPKAGWFLSILERDFVITRFRAA